MALSSELISQFAKTVVGEKKESGESTAYGTVVEHNGEKYVKLDGSDMLTPVSATARFEDGERVTVMIKNHTATVTGNLSSPAPRSEQVDNIGNEVKDIGTKISEFEIIIAGKVDTVELTAQIARIDELSTDNVTIKETLMANEADIRDLEADNATIKGTLTAHDADIKDLEVENATITGKLEAADADIKTLQADNVIIRGTIDANEADIKNLQTSNVTVSGELEAAKAKIDELETGKLSAKDIEGKFANIDFSNIGEAAIEKLFSESGIIKDLVIDEGHITGELVGVTIKGDIIEGGTVIADKLVVKGEDGLFYKLNTDGVNVDAEQTEYNSLNGSVITAKSITAEKVNVSDLVAFGATIGGFHIDSHSLYSGSKVSAINTTRGVYLGDNGEFAVGDSSNFLRYYKDEDGYYKLEISAAVVRIGGSVKPLQEELDEVKNSIDNIQIGGRNHITRSDLRGSTLYGITIDIIGDEVHIYGTNTKTDVAWGNGLWINRDDVFVPGETYTLSTTKPLPQGLYLGCNTRNMSGTYISAAPKSYLFGDGSTTSNTFVVADESDGSANGFFGFQPSLTSPIDIRFKIKLEKGNRATDWTPAPEDVTSSIDAVQKDLDEAKDNITTNLRIESSRGTVFKNDSISTVLSAVIYRGNQRITDMVALRSAMGSGAYLQWKWQRLDETSFGVISASDTRLGNDGFTFTLSPSDVDTKVTFMCELIV